MSEMNQNKNDTCVAGVTGRVKWFNNKRGYGFITTITGGVDVFARHSAITTTDEQFLYLVEGEYVSFGMVQTASESGAVPRWEATTITGYGGGKLMCETRNDAVMIHMIRNYEKDEDEDEDEDEDAVGVNIVHQ